MSSTVKTLAVLSGLAAASPAWTQEPVPTTVAQGWDQIHAALSEDARVYYLAPPGNVRAEHYHTLFGDTVMVSWMNIYVPEQEGLKIIFIGADGRYVWCTLNLLNERVWYEVRWRAELHWDPSGALVPIFNPNDEFSNGVGLSPLYDGQTGGTIWYSFGDGFWWDWNRGHLQTRLPAVTWTLCPDFPTADALGVGVNQAQTATSYEALLAQDPGQRVLRPDLVTPNVMELYE